MFHHAVVKFRQLCMLSVHLNFPHQANGQQKDGSCEQIPTAVKFQRLNTPEFSLSESHSVRTHKQSLHNYQQLQSKLPSTVTKWFCVCFKGPYKWMCVKSCLFFHWVRNLLIPEHFKVFTGTSHNRISLWTRQQIKERGCCRHKYGNNMTQWERRVLQWLDLQTREQDWSTHERGRDLVWMHVGFYQVLLSN